MKKKLLISFPPTVIHEALLPLTRELSKDFSMFVTAVDYLSPPGFVATMRLLEKEGIIERFLFIPNPRETRKMFSFLKRETRWMKELQFSVWLSLGEGLLENRYISECILPENCARIILWHNPTHLFHDENLTRQLLNDTNGAHSVAPKASPPPGLLQKMMATRSPAIIFGKAVTLIKRRLKYSKEELVNRVLLPRLIVGKSFRLQPYDRLSPLNLGKANTLIFCDELEAKAHKALFKTPQVYVAQYPTHGFCRCRGAENKMSALLMPLSGFIQQKTISEEYLQLYYRDCKTVLEETGIKSVHLRMHPDETTTWYHQLRDYLVARDVDASVVGCEKPLREVVCDYKGVAGFGSCALRDSRAICNHIFVVGFEAVSKFSHKNPKFRFGNSEGIGWIHEDGSFDPSIFDIGIYQPPVRKNISTIIREVSGLSSL